VPETPQPDYFVEGNSVYEQAFEEMKRVIEERLASLRL
jgi:hypothetical protein